MLIVWVYNEFILTADKALPFSDRNSLKGYVKRANSCWFSSYKWHHLGIALKILTPKILGTSGLAWFNCQALLMTLDHAEIQQTVQLKMIITPDSRADHI